jgi:hypothetical protein
MALPCGAVHAGIGGYNVPSSSLDHVIAFCVIAAIFGAMLLAWAIHCEKERIREQREQHDHDTDTDA